MTTRQLTADELREEIAVTQNDLTQLRAQLRTMECLSGETVVRRIFSITELPLTVKQIAYQVGISRDSVYTTTSRMVEMGLLSRVKHGVFQRRGLGR